MAGEIEEPIRLDFQAGSFHSGSISFGRFENETLCWERRSSFSRNTYLEDVEKYSKPGSVTEKKAYFEAHFRKKRNNRLSSIGSQNEYQNSENDISEKTCYDEETNHVNAEYEASTYEARFELSCDSIDNTERILELGNVDEMDCAKIGRSGIEVNEGLDGEEYSLDTISNVSIVNIGLLSVDHATEENNDASLGSPSEDKVPSQVNEYMKLTLSPRDSVAQSQKYISDRSPKDSEENSSKTVNNVPMRSKSENKTSKAAAQDKRPMHRNPKNESGSKAKEIGDKRNDRISRNRRIEEAQSPTLPKVSSRVHQRANRINYAVDNSKFGLKCNERAETRKEFDKKFEEKRHTKEAEMRQRRAKTQEESDTQIKQLRKSLNFKAKPLPSFYRGALRESDRNKAISSNAKPQNIRINSKSSPLSCLADKDEAIFISGSTKLLNDPPQASGGTSCHSTLTSDSSPSSPSAEISKGRLSQAVTINSWKKENENDKIGNPHKNKGLECKKTDRGKTVDGKQKKRTERTIYAAFTNNSRTR